MVFQVGKERMYNLGKWFRDRYKNFDLVVDGYKHDRLLMNSSSKDRTLMSAELVLAGFMPPKPDEIWTSDDLQWQPIPVHNVPLNLDQVSLCVRFSYYSRQNSELVWLTAGNRNWSFVRQIQARMV